MKNNSEKNWVFTTAILILLLLAIPPHFVFANSPAAPTKVWFYFNFDQYSWREVQGIQVIGCSTENCNEPILLHQYGLCTNERCLKSEAVFDDEGYKLDCADKRCYSVVYPNHGGTDFKVLIQLNDITFISGVVNSLPSMSGESKSWVIDVKKESLNVITGSVEKDKGRLNNSLLSISLLFVLSIFTEILIATLFFRRFSNKEPKEIKNLLGIVLLINFVTLPVVWFSFPALGYFHTIGSLKSGLFTFFVSLVNALLFIIIYKASPERRAWFFTKGVILIPVSIPISICLILGSLVLNSYAYPTVVAQGLPAFIIITLEEVFAVVVEALLLIQLSNHAITKKQAWVLALVMNTVSFLIGQALQLFVR